MDTVYKLQTIKIRLKVSQPEGKSRTGTDAAVRILRKIYSKLDADQEHFSILVLNGKMRIRGYKVLFSGGTTSAHVDPKIVFRAALLLGAEAIVIAHNHPSGDPSPSAEDKELTARLEALGEQLQIKVVDHIILGDWGSWSLAEKRIRDNFISRLMGENRPARRARIEQPGRRKQARR